MFCLCCKRNEAYIHDLTRMWASLMAVFLYISLGIVFDSEHGMIRAINMRNSQD